MSVYTDAARVAVHKRWIERVNLIAANSAADVLAEDPATAQHAARVALAAATIRGELAGMWARIVLTNEAVRAGAAADAANAGDAVPDGDIEFTCNSLFGTLPTALFPAAVSAS